MRIDRIKIINYRQYKNICVDFSHKNPQDLHLLIGKNGAGKTNFLNAINWCLYNDEPYLGSKNKGMPTANIFANNGEDTETTVELWVKVNENETIIFSRKAFFAFNNVSKQLNLSPFKTDFFAERCLSDGKTEPINSDLDIFVDRIFPKGIREYFFFDGEQLDTYFKEGQQSKISNMVYNISQLDLIDDSIKQMEKIDKEILKNIGKENPDIESKNNEIENAKRSIEQLKKEKHEHSLNISKSKIKLDEISKELYAMPDVESLEKERNQNKEKVKECLFEIKELKKKKNATTMKHLKYVPFLVIFPDIKNIIEEKRVAKELPPTIDDELIDRILKQGLCTVCNRDLDQKSKKELQSIRNKTILKTRIGSMLLETEKCIGFYENDFQHLRVELESLKKHIKTYEDFHSNLSEELRKIDSKLIGFDSKKIRFLQEERATYESLYNNSISEESRIKNRIIQQEGALRQMEASLRQEISKVSKVKKLKNEKFHTEIILEKLRELKAKLSKEIKDQIQETTNQVFKDLIWKKETFDRVLVSENYSVSLMHSEGYECLSTISAGERELLALSFTLALHKLSGFESPIVIDTPLARISDAHRVSFGKIFNEVSKEKQVLLFLTPSEFSDDVREIFHTTASTHCYLQMSNDETETMLKEAH